MENSEFCASEGYDEPGNRARVELLRSRGVETWGPERVYIGPEVSPERIEPRAVLKHAVVTGKHTFIAGGATIGTSGIAHLHDCQVAERVQLGAGYYDRATFLTGSKARGFAEVRQGTLLEEEAEVGHNVGLKHTLFTTAVVAGSSINFCDLVVTGGTSRSDHTEIGSGAVHFNFDARGDKFGSLLGDVRGVLLRSPKIFVGGNTGLLAPLHVDFGAVIPAGCTVRKDVGANRIYQPIAQGSLPTDFNPSVYFDVRRKFINTAKLVGNLHAFSCWYRDVRLKCASKVESILCDSALQQIDVHIRHRVNELEKVIGKLDNALCRAITPDPFQEQHQRLVHAGRDIAERLSTMEDERCAPEALIAEYGALRSSQSHCDAIRQLSDIARLQAEQWLMHVPSTMVARMSALFG